MKNRIKSIKIEVRPEYSYPERFFELTMIVAIANKPLVCFVKVMEEDDFLSTYESVMIEAMAELKVCLKAQKEEEKDENNKG